jgi:hypothetical protein
VLVPGRPFQLCLMFVGKASGLYYKLMTIVNDDSRVVNKLEAPLINDTRVIIYVRHMLIVQATGAKTSVEHLKGATLR